MDQNIAATSKQVQRTNQTDLVKNLISTFKNTIDTVENIQLIQQYTMIQLIKVSSSFYIFFLNIFE